MSLSTAGAARLNGCAVLVLAALFLTTATSAQAAGPTMQVEQEWELVVGEPDPETDAPQIVCVVSPVSDTNALHAVFEINQQTLPAFHSGGIQLQIWDSETPLGGRNACDTVALTAPNEKITWTLRMTLANGVLTFAVPEGYSPTLGNFGGDGTLVASVKTSLANLDAYDPAVSIRNSGANFAPNRIISMTLKRSRYFSADGAMREDATAKTVAINQ